MNIIGQLYFLNQFIGTKYLFWGYQMFMDLMQGREWENSGHFPRVTLCDFHMRTLGNVHRYTVQCVLMINMFNEKIYIFIWFWLVLVGGLTALNLLYWLGSTSCSNARTIHKYLRIAHDLQPGMDLHRTVARFQSALRPDGVLMLRFISGHAGDLVATELTGILWKDFTDQIACLADRDTSMTSYHIETDGYPGPPPENMKI